MFINNVLGIEKIARSVTKHMWNSNLIKLHNSWNDISIEHTTEPIYHYTSRIGLDGIFENRQLWANDIYKQNDKSEGLYVLDVLEKNITSFGIQEDYKNAILRRVKIIKSLDEESYELRKHRSFIISFSIAGDELALWNYYTKNEDSVGYNVMFDTKMLTDKIKIKKLIRDNDANAYYPGIIDDNIRHGKVIYDECRQCEIMKREIEKFEKYFDKNNDLCEYLLVEKILWIGNFFKSPYFKHEYEYRLAFFVGTDLEYPSKDRIAVEVRGEKKNHIEVYYNPNSILAVTCSPTNKRDDIEYARKFVTNAFPNFKSVNISKIPFRVI